MPGDVTGYIEAVKKILEAGAAVFMGLLLLASFFRIWMWRKDHADLLAAETKRIEERDERIAELTAECKELKDMLYGLVPSLQATVTNTLTKRRG